MPGQYTCLDCGETFDEPQHWVERHGLDSPPFEEFDGCPCCGGAFVRTIICDGCGEAITGDYVQLQDSGACYCDECFMKKSLGDD